MSRCPRCMSEKYSGTACPVCDFEQGDPLQINGISSGTMLKNRYQLGVPVCKSRQAICYAAWDQKKRRAVIAEEFYPERICGRRDGMVFPQENAKSRFDAALQIFQNPRKGGDRPLNCEEAFAYGGTAIRIYPGKEGKIPEEAKKLLASPILFRNDRGEIMMSIDALKIPAIQETRSPRNMREADSETAESAEITTAPSTESRRKPERRQTLVIFLIILFALAIGMTAGFLLERHHLIPDWFPFQNQGDVETEVPTEVPTEELTETMEEVDSAALTMGEKGSEPPIENLTSEQTEEPSGVPVVDSTDAPTTESIDTPSDESLNAPKTEVTDAPSDEPSNTPTTELTETSTEEPSKIPTAEPDINSPAPEETETLQKSSLPASKGTVIRRIKRETATETLTENPTEELTEEPSSTPTAEKSDALTEKATQALIMENVENSPAPDETGEPQETSLPASTGMVIRRIKREKEAEAPKANSTEKLTEEPSVTQTTEPTEMLKPEPSSTPAGEPSNAPVEETQMPAAEQETDATAPDKTEKSQESPSQASRGTVIRRIRKGKSEEEVKQEIASSLLHGDFTSLKEEEWNGEWTKAVWETLFEEEYQQTGLQESLEDSIQNLMEHSFQIPQIKISWKDKDAKTEIRRAAVAYAVLKQVSSSADTDPLRRGILLNAEGILYDLEEGIPEEKVFRDIKEALIIQKPDIAKKNNLDNHGEGADGTYNKPFRVAIREWLGVSGSTERAPTSEEIQKLVKVLKDVTPEPGNSPSPSPAPDASSSPDLEQDEETSKSGENSGTETSKEPAEEAHAEPIKETKESAEALQLGSESNTTATEMKKQTAAPKIQYDDWGREQSTSQQEQEP